jgi:hypothetical protein
MELLTTLNRSHHFRGFVYRHTRFSQDRKRVVLVVIHCGLPFRGRHWNSQTELAHYPVIGSARGLGTGKRRLAALAFCVPGLGKWGKSWGGAGALRGRKCRVLCLPGMARRVHLGEPEPPPLCCNECRIQPF